MADILFTLNVVAPIFLTLFLGLYLRRSGVIDEGFVRTSSVLVFKVALPALIFVKTASIDFREFVYPAALWIYNGGTVAAFAVAWLLSLLVVRPRSRGAFIQGSMRSNMAIIGLSLVVNMLGEEALPKAIVVMTSAMPVYNVLAVIALTVSGNRTTASPIRAIAVSIATNPLILATLVGLAFAALGLHIPTFLDRTGTYLANLALPLGVIGIGATLNLGGLKRQLPVALTATALKIVLVPAAFVAAGVAAGLPSGMLAILFALGGCPTAIASFIMAKAMHNDSELAAGIVFLSTLLSLPTLSVGIFLLRVFGVV